MLGKCQFLFVIRFVLILVLFTGMSGVGNVRADSPGAEAFVPEAVVVTVQNTEEMPMVGLNVYAFDGTTYTGLHGITAENGQLTLQLPEGAYRFRADFNGTQFWSGTSNHCDIPGCSSVSITVSRPVMVTVLDTDGAPKAGLNVYAFNNSTYSGYNKTTNADGQATFTLPLGSYRFRADLNGTQFWSGMSNHCDLPGCETAAVTVSKPVTVTVLDTDGAPKTGLNVYAFNNSTYSGYSKVTDGNGQATFTLPLGGYRFRADLNGTQFWSGASNHCDIPGCDSVSVTVGKPVMVTVLDTDGAPKAGLNVYAFNNSTYSGYNKTTNADGQVILTLPLGNYRFRADLNGTQFWSGTSNHCGIPGCENVQMTVTVPLTVTVQDGGGVPKSGVNIYAFNGTTYTGYSKVSDASGQAIFTLPQGSYRFRADYSGAQYWSASINHCTLPGCLNALVIVGPSMTATPLPTHTSTATPTLTYTSTATPTSTSTPTSTPIPITRVVANANNSGAGSLRQVIEEANSGDRIVFAPSLAGQTITLATDLMIEKNLIIDGSGLSPQVTISGGGNAHILIALSNSTVTISSLTISNCYGSFGGGIESRGNLTIINSTLRNNESTIFGGAIMLSGGRSLTLINSTIYQNQAEIGGALMTNGGNITIINSTITQNQADRGGALHINGGTKLDIFNSTFAGNNATIEGKEFLINGTLIRSFYNTIFVCTGENNCYFNNGSEPILINSTLATGSLESLGLLDLADNGGPTRTMALAPGSILIDAGNDAICSSSPVNSLDQRGVVRPAGAHCDIGAYEAGVVSMPSATATPTSTYTPTSTPTRIVTQIPTGTPTITSTPVVGCNAIQDAFIGIRNPIKISGRTTIYLDIPNPNPYLVTIQSIYLVWNYNGGHHSPFDTSLRLQKAELPTGNVVWTGDAPGPFYTITSPSSPPLLLPPGGARLTFTFHQSYDISNREEIRIQFSTPGCGAYPVQVRN